MRRRLSIIGVLVLILAVLAGGLSSCARPARERASQATEAEAEAEGTDAESGVVPATPAPGETVVSAVTPAAFTPTAVIPSTEVPAGQESAEVGPTATAVPVVATAAPQPAQPSQGTSGEQVVHTVQPGETLSSIGRFYGTTWQVIAEANGITNPNQIYTGQKLKIPTSGTTSSGTSSTGCRVKHTVQQGEWVWQIARNYGVSPYDILAANGLTIQTANTIYPGKVLCIP